MYTDIYLENDELDFVRIHNPIWTEQIICRQRHIDRDRFPEPTGPVLIRFPAPDSLIRPRGYHTPFRDPLQFFFNPAKVRGGAKMQTVIGAFGTVVPLCRGSGWARWRSIGSTRKRFRAPLLWVADRICQWVLLAGVGELFLLAGQSYPWLRELEELICSKDEGILQDVYSIILSPSISTVRSHVSSDVAVKWCWLGLQWDRAPLRIVANTKCPARPQEQLRGIVRFHSPRYHRDPQ